MVLLAVSFALLLLSFVFRILRSRSSNSITRSLVSGWPSAAFWFGVVALLFTVSRVETIQFLSMRVLWALWVLFLLLYVLIQFVQFRRRHYTIVKQAHVIDEREKYLPKKKR